MLLERLEDRLCPSGCCYVPPPPGLISWWPGDGNASDIQGTNHGTLQNGATFAPGLVGQAFSFDGVDDAVSVPKTPFEFGTASFSVAFWFKTSSAARMSLVSNHHSGNEGWEIIQETSAPGTPVHFYVCDGNTCSTATSGSALFDGNWHYLAAVRDSSAGVMRLYVDGALKSQVTIPASMSANNDNGTTLAIGNRPSSPTPLPFNGLMDEVKVVNRALTAVEIQAAVNAGIGGSCRTCTPSPSGLVSWWPGDGNPSDIQGSNHGILRNGATFAPGTVGQAFSLDGVDDFVEVPDSPSLRISGSLTIDAWINRVIGPQFPSIVTKYESNPGGGGVAYALLLLDGDTPSARVRFAVYQTSDATVRRVMDTTTGVVPANQPIHVAGSFDITTQQMKIYVNGVDVPTVFPEGASATITSIYPSSSPVRIGSIRNFAGNDTDPFKGTIDEAEIFNRALSAAEIQAIVNVSSAGKCRTCTPPPSGLLSWWPGDGSPTDIQGSNHGTLQNGATFAPGVVGQAFSLDGVDDRVDVGDLGISNDSQAISVAAWINPTQATLLGGTRIIFGNGGLHGGPNFGAFNVQLYTTDEGGLGGLNWHIGNAQVWSARKFTGSVLSAGQWTFVVATYDGSRTRAGLKLYVNGTEQVTSDGGVGFGTPGTSLDDWRIGASKGIGSGAEFHFGGRIDEADIYNRALSAAEIQALVNAGSAGKCRTCTAPPSGIVSWWTGDGNTNDITSDLHGTAFNGATFAPGMVGQAFSFDGVNDYVFVPSSPAFGSSQGTIDAWIKPTTLSGVQRVVFFNQPGRGYVSLFHLDGRVYAQTALEIGGLGHTQFRTPAVLTAGEWAHVAWTADGATWKVYVNGVEQLLELVPSTTTQHVSQFTNALSVHDLTIGNDAPFFDQPFNGLIDEVEFANRAFTTAEIQAIVNARAAGKCKFSVTPRVIPDGMVGQAYSQALGMFAGVPPVTFALASGALPGGLSLSSAGVLSGTPTATGIFNFTVQATDALGQTAQRAYSVRVFSAICLPAPAGLVSWWAGDGNANDIQGGRHGTAFNGATFAAGRVGPAFSFDGVNDYVFVPSSPAFSLAQGTIDAWIKPTTLSGVQRIAFFNQPGRGYVSLFQLNGRIHVQITLEIESVALGASNYRTPAVLTAGEWAHVAWTADGTTWRVYVNGVEQPLSLDFGSNVHFGKFTSVNTVHDFTIGNDAPFFDQPFNGLIDEVELLNRALSTAEVQAIFLAGSFGKCKNRPPTAIPGGPYSVPEGGSVTLLGAGTDPDVGDTLTYAWDLDNNGSFETAGQNVTFSAAGRDGPSSQIVGLQVCDAGGLCAAATAIVNITNVAPTAVLFNGGAVILGEAGSVSFSNQFDPSPTDTSTGFRYSYDFDNDGTFEITDSTAASAVVPASFLATPGMRTVRARILDKDGGFTDYLTTIEVLTPAQAVDNLIAQVNGANIPAGFRNALLGTLRAAQDSFNRGNETAALNQLGAFQNQVRAQAGRHVDAATAAALLAYSQRIIDARRNT